MVRKDSRARETAGIARAGETPIVTMRDDDLVIVTGGVFANAFATAAIRTIGEALGTMARKG